MPWAKLDDSFWSHPKVIAAGNEAAGAYARMLSYCGNQLTDGRIPSEVAKFIAKPGLISKLEQFSFIVQNGDGYLIPDYLAFNPSREKVTEDRRKAAERKAKSRQESQRDT